MSTLLSLACRDLPIHQEMAVYLHMECVWNGRVYYRDLLSISPVSLSMRRRVLSRLEARMQFPSREKLTQVTGSVGRASQLASIWILNSIITGSLAIVSEWSFPNLKS